MSFKSKILLVFCALALLVQAPLSQAHLQKHLAQAGHGLILAGSQVTQPATQDTEDCPVCKLFQGLSQILKLTAAIQVAFLLFAAYALFSFTAFVPQPARRQILPRGPPQFR